MQLRDGSRECSPDRLGYWDDSSESFALTTTEAPVEAGPFTNKRADQIRGRRRSAGAVDSIENTPTRRGAW
jgi:hypothetical protein